MYIYLDIVKDFSCEMCGHCCRNDWQVTLTEETYRRNERMFKSTGRLAEFRQAFIPLNGSGGLGEYAYIAKQPGGGCWFLAEENYCRLHREAGPSQLDTVCRLFPRYPMSSARGQELTLSFSCPAVLKLASRELPLAVLRAQQAPLTVLDEECVAYVYPEQQRPGSILRHYFELEQHFMDIMQWRGKTVAERLRLLGKTIRQVEHMGQDPFSCGSNLTALFNKNYDSFAASPALPAAKADILLENFFVNFIFKKTFYFYGLQPALHLCERVWRYVEKLRQSTRQGEEEYAAVKQAIMAVEFHYGHNRKTLWQGLIN